MEFGQKLGFSVVDGYTFIDAQSFDNFNEGVTLIASAEKYKARFGHYPERILADTIYRNRENRRFCKEHGIRLSGPRLGRPKADELEADREMAYRDSCDRNIVGEPQRHCQAALRFRRNTDIPELHGKNRGGSGCAGHERRPLPENTFAHFFCAGVPAASLF